MMVLMTTTMEINQRSMNVMVVNGELVIISRLSIGGGCEYTECPLDDGKT